MHPSLAVCEAKIAHRSATFKIAGAVAFREGWLLPDPFPSVIEEVQVVTKLM